MKSTDYVHKRQKIFQKFHLFTGYRFNPYHVRIFAPNQPLSVFLFLPPFLLRFMNEMHQRFYIRKQQIEMHACIIRLCESYFFSFISKRNAQRRFGSLLLLYSIFKVYADKKDERNVWNGKRVNNKGNNSP